MPNDILTSTKVMREALRILHAKLSFINSIHRGYDKEFGKKGEKIGDELIIRLPNEYVVRRGRTIQVQDSDTPSTTLAVTEMTGVDLNFTDVDLTLHIDQFSEQYLDPAMSTLASDLEARALLMYKDIPNEVSDIGATMTILDILEGQVKLTDSLAPDEKRCLQLTTRNNADLVGANIALFNDRTKISEQYRKGLIGNDFFGFDNVFQNTLLPLHTTGTDDGTGDYLIDGAGQTGAAMTVGTGAGTFKQGDVVAIDGVFAVHPETKVSSGVLKQFVLTADTGISATSLPISPPIVTSGGKQNVSAAPADTAAIFKRESDNSTAIGASADYRIALGYQKDAFAFATADLEVPRGVDFASRQVMDNISMRIVRDFDINDANFPCRIDVLHGQKTIRSQLATRFGFN